LDQALSACDELLQVQPNRADVLDSRARVELRTGNMANAIKDDTAALALEPKLAGSLYVRGLAKLKSGDAAGGNADIEAAKAIDPKIIDTYAGYGVKP
jgi:tetratricopeptide (TPR) repeat protein